MKLRKIKGSDIFIISRILSKMDLEVKQLNFKFGKSDMPESEKEKLNEHNMQIGMQVVKNVFENLHKAEKEVNGFLATLSGASVGAITELSLKEYKNLIMQLKDDEEIAGFFK